MLLNKLLEVRPIHILLLLLPQKYEILKRRARQITSNASLMIKDYIEERGLNRPEMKAKFSMYF